MTTICPPEHLHGVTESCHRHHGCRCSPCRDNATRKRRRRREAASTGSDLCPPDHKHDSSSTCYRAHGCRCAPCREDSSQRYADWRAKTRGRATTPNRAEVEAARRYLARCVPEAGEREDFEQMLGMAA